MKFPQYNDIRQDVGFKNVMVANRMIAESTRDSSPPAFIDPTEASTFLKHKYPAYYLWVVLHELFGHGTGKLLIQEADGSCNFSRENLPINPVTGQPVSSWYHHGQTWTGLFGDLATSLDECRAECVGAYLLSDKEMLAMYDFTDESETTAEEREYYFRKKNSKKYLKNI